MKSLVYLLTSSKLDAASSLFRSDVVKDCADQVTSDAASRRELAELNEQDVKCNSLHAYRRTIKLYGLAIVSCIKEEKKTILGLCKGLCRLIAESKTPSLLEPTLKQLSQAENRLLFARKFHDIASSVEGPAYAPALSLGSTLEGSNKREEWIKLFTEKTLSGSTFASANEINMMCLFVNTITQDEFGPIASVMGLKLKANPERALETVKSVLDGLPPTLDLTLYLEGDTQLLASVLKQTKSTKENVRNLACSALTRMALVNPSSTEVLSKVSTQIALAVSTSMPQPDQRSGAYLSLRDIAVCITSKMKLNSTVLENVLSGICTALGKESKTGGARQEGLEALLQWMVVSKRNTPDNKGYQKALEYMRKPVLTNNSADLIFCYGMMIQELNLDMVESIVLDLYKETKFEPGLCAVVEGAVKKHNASSTVPPVEGLIAVYLALTHALVSKAHELKPAMVKVLSAGSMALAKTSFLYGVPMTDGVTTNPLIGQLLCSTIAMYTKLLSKQDNQDILFCMVGRNVSAASRALAVCITHPPTRVNIPTETLLSCIQTVLTYQPLAADPLLEAILEQVNQRSLQHQDLASSLNETRETRESVATPAVQESYTKLPIKGQHSTSASHFGLDPNCVRRVAMVLASHTRSAKGLSQALVLAHTGSTLRGVGRQRVSLIARTLELLRNVILPFMEKEPEHFASLADFVSTCASSYDVGKEASESSSDEKIVTSVAVHQAALSLITTMGGIAGNFDPEYDDPTDEDLKPYVFSRRLCIEELAPRLATSMKNAFGDVEQLSEKELGLYHCPAGVPFYEDGNLDPNGKKDSESKSQNADRKKSGGKSRRGKGGFGGDFEDEEWERQMKKELEAKKKQDTKVAGAASLSPEQKKLVEEQNIERKRIAGILEGRYSRVLSAIQCLCLSDIGVGNACLPLLGDVVIASTVSKCIALQKCANLKNKSEQTLTTLAGCVYEIAESFAPILARALMLSFFETKSNGLKKEGKSTNSPSLTVSALPSPCPPAASAIFEMEDFQDTLSGESFAFLFGIIHASLMGPRTIPGTDAALVVLHRHTEMLTGEKKDKSVLALRKEMVITVLGLLAYDRSQTYTDPSPYEALVACYDTDVSDTSESPPLSTAELAPLLDERGALGKKNCRIGSMMALESIAKVNPKLVKNNPLMENRIWLNCFDKNESVRLAARRTWRVASGYDAKDEDNLDAWLPRPSPMYAIPLLPLLHNSDSGIAGAAADAFAYGMGKHPSSVDRNIEKLCTTYIESFPTSVEEGSKKSLLMPSQSKKPALSAVPQPKKTAKISTGLPKKKATKKSPLGISGIGKPRTTTKTGTKKKSAAASALLAPKKERTLDRAELESQFLNVGEKNDAEKDSPEKVAIRLGVLRAITALTDASASVKMDITTVTLLTGFLMAFGIADSDNDVQSSARNALRDVVATNGESEEAIAFLLPHLEAVLSTGVADEECLGSLPREKVPKDVKASDRRKEGAVVALGSVALHLKGEDNFDKIDSTVDMLISTLSTPSEDVQASVATGLAKLMKKGKTQERIEDIVSRLMKDCLHGESLATRRGAAYGISAVVKGSGIATLKKYEVVKQLEEACATGSSTSKEGALFAVELLSDRLGLLFEPYVIVLLPSLLKSFSDSSDHVRTAASHTAGVIMSKLSAHGVKLVMPAVLTAFDDPAWRTKQASIHMLGSMSHMAPKQLASALPKVVPKVTEAFSDTHPKVKASAEEALQEISNVIKNPEISSISPVLLGALTDPAEGTVTALESLIETEFLHAIDAPSLALIVPVLHRGLRDRGAKTKRYGALISGNICTMIDDPRDFVPYLPILLPDLKACLLDPIPDVRSTSAKALGSLTRGLSDDSLPDLRPWLITTLRDENISSAERSGAGQGLAEVLIAGGASVVEVVMTDEILPLGSHPQASTREGVLWVLTFLPSSLGQAFTPLIDKSLPALLGGLSDDSEPVREVAMRAGRVLIRSHGRTHVNKILPSLETGLGDDDYRIRVASLTLLGDLLSMIGGTTVVKGDGDTQDDLRRAERAQAQIALVLGNDTRKQVLSRLYLSRCDTVAVVRQNAVQVWKTVVSVTGRALREILPVLVGQVVEALASGHPERTQVAGRCLGDITNKLGESVLPEIIPVLRDALYSGDVHTRRGVCVGLSEVISGSSKENILRFVEIIVKVVKDALCDDDEGVREVAASCFQRLHALIGARALEEIVPSLLIALEKEDEEGVERVRALNGLTAILSIRSKELLPYIIPRLLRRPITKSHADALSNIALVTGGSIHMHFNTILPALISELGDFSGEDDDEVEKEREESVRNLARSICGNVEEGGVNWLVGEIAGKCGSDSAKIRKESCWMLQVVVEERKEEKDFYEQIPIILRELLYRFNDDDPVVVKAAHSAFGALSKHVPAEELVKHIEFIRNLLNSMVSDARRRKGGVGDGEFLLPAFNMPKGLEPMLPIYQRGILYGDANIREVSATGLGELISLTSIKYLAGPLIVKMTGPLLRVVGDRNPPAVKVAILRTLGLILVKGGPALRAFVPQFQTTFVKALSDPSRQVRIEAIHALSLLMPLSTRVDPLVKELVAGSLGGKSTTGGTGETAAVAAIQTATLEALAGVLRAGGKKAKLAETVPSALKASTELISHEDDGVRESAAKVMGAACELLDVQVTEDLVQNEILIKSSTANWEKQHGVACACHYIMASSVGPKLQDTTRQDMTNLIVSYINSDKAAVKEAALVAIGAAVGSAPDDPAAALRQVEPLLLEIMNDSSQSSMDVLRSLARGLCIAIRLAGQDDGGVTLFGKALLDACLQQAMSGIQRVQFAFNNVLWLALDVANGDAGLEAYINIANFDNSKAMKALYSKVLIRIKEVPDKDM